MKTFLLIINLVISCLTSISLNYVSNLLHKIKFAHLQIKVKFAATSFSLIINLFVHQSRFPNM